MVETRRRDERRPVLTAGRHAPPPPQQRPVTTEQVSLSLESLVEELANHVAPEKRPQVELLRRLAAEKPDQHAKVKEQMLRIGGAEAMRAAVSALLGSARKTPSPPPPPAPPAASAVVWPNGQEPPMPPNLPAIFGSTASTSEELQAFKSELLHAFHCRAPSCPISGCNALSTKLQRLQVHLQTCREETCLLCSIGSYLRTYNNAVAAPAGADGGVCAPCGPTAGASAGSSDPLSLGGGMSPLYVNELLASRQRLPCYDRETGKVSWMNPRDALESIRHMSGGFPMPPGAAGAPSAADLLGSSGFDGDPLAKRQRRDGGGGSGSHSDSVLSALGAYPGLHQGVLGGGPGGSGAGAFGGLGLPNFGAGGSMADAYAAHQGSQQGAMPRVPDENGKRSGGGGGGNGSRDFASMAAEMVQGIGGMYEPLGANFGAKRPHSMTGGGSEGNYENGYPMPAGLMSSLAGLPMSQAKSRSFGLGLSSSNLQELIKSTSLSDLGLGLGLNRSYSGGLGASMADLGSDLGLSLAKSRSELKDANSSNFSLSGLLGEGAHDIVSGLALGRSKSNLGLDVNGAGGGAGGRSDGLADIMGDFGGGGAAASASTPQISAK